MIRLKFICLLVIVSSEGSYAQKERKMVRDGVNDYKEEKFTDAEVKFQKALDAKPGLFEAEYNIANSLYKEKKYEDAAREYEQLIQRNKNPEKSADLYHNLGNANLMAQQYEQGIDAYKKSLRIRPGDEDTRYNLAYAQSKLKEQQKQNDQNKDKQNKDNQNKDQKDQDKQSQKDQEKQNKEQQEQQGQQDKKDQQQKNEQKENQDKKDQKKEGKEDGAEEKVSKLDAEQMLNAIQNQEKEVKMKVDKKKAVARPLKSEKDW